MNDEQIAKVAHEVNRAYCRALGDTSQPVWEDAPERQRNSVVHGVAFVRANPDAGPRHNHAEWLREKTEAGWTYEPVKDVEKKEHPCMQEFDSLSIEQQAKDFIFLGVVRALIG